MPMRGPWASCGSQAWTLGKLWQPSIDPHEVAEAFLHSRLRLSPPAAPRQV